MRKSPNEWFIIWSNIIKKRKEISRRDLADISGASIWTIKSLSNDFVEGEAYVTYRNKKYYWFTPRLELTLSTLSDEDKEELK